jgi:hypothetical protein
MIEAHVDCTMRDVLFPTEYIAAITGADPKYILRRAFIPAAFWQDEENNYIYMLDTGVYEASFAVHAIETGERVFWTRRWMVVLDDRQYEYEYDQMSAQDVLYTLFNLKLQEGVSPQQAISDMIQHA